MFGVILIFVLMYIGPPVCVGAAWWLWPRSQRDATKKWRSWVLLTGILAGSINVLVFYSLLLHRLAAKDTPGVWKIEEVCGVVGMSLALVALGGGFFGEGVARIPLLLCAVLGLCMWGSFAV
jgi:hypothetical protein